MTQSARSIGDRIATGAFWTIGMRLSIRALGVVSVIILARILVPEDFGIVAKAAMIAGVLEMILEFGLDAALIHNRKATSLHYDTVWTIHVIRGSVIALILAALAKPAATFFHEPVLSVILLFYALSSLMNGLQNVGIVDFRKNLEFDRDFLFSLYRKLASFVVTIAIAYAYRSYWAFVIGVLVASVTGLVASYVMSGYRPKWALTEWRSLFHFSKWLFTSSLVVSISLKLDIFILSRFSATEVVGRYTVADEIAGAASTELAMPIARATMPGLAKLNDDADGFMSTYTLSILIVMLISVPAATGLAALSAPIVYVVLGPKWAAAAELVKLLALFGVMRAIFALSASAFMSSGKVKTLAGLSIFNLFLRAVALSIGFAVGDVIGLAWGVVIAAAIQMCASIYVQHSLGFINIVDLLSGLWRVITAALIMYFSLTVCFVDLPVIATSSEGLRLVVQIIAGAAIYFLSIAVLWLLFSKRGGPEQAVLSFVKKKVFASRKSG